MSKKYLFIDTNIYLFCALLQKNEKHNSGLVQKLIDVINKNNIILLLPETVLLEYKRLINDLFEKRKKSITTTIESLQEYQSIEKQSLSKAIKDIEANSIKVDSQLDKLFNDKLKTKILRITPEILVDGYKRALIWKKPFSIQKFTHEAWKESNKKSVSINNPLNADCITIETIINFFKENNNENKLIFCTDDSDFSEKWKLYSEIEKDIKAKIYFYNDLIALLDKEFWGKVSKTTSKSYEEVTKISKVWYFKSNNYDYNRLLLGSNNLNLHYDFPAQVSQGRLYNFPTQITEWPLYITDNNIWIRESGISWFNNINWWFNYWNNWITNSWIQIATICPKCWLAYLNQLWRLNSMCPNCNNLYKQN